MRERLRADLCGRGTLLSLCHLLRTADPQRARGFHVDFPGFEEDAGYDLLLARGGVEAEVVCDVVSAEEGRLVHQGAWSRLADRMEVDARAWLVAHPGRYLLKMTLPQGLQGGLHEPMADGGALSSLHMRIRRLLETMGRRDHDDRLVLRLDPLVLARRRTGQPALWRLVAPGVRPGSASFGHRSGRRHLCDGGPRRSSGRGCAAVRRRLAVIAPTRLTGTRPGILAMFLDDTDRARMARTAREHGTGRPRPGEFLAHKEARPVIAVTCTSQFELFGASAPLPRKTASCGSAIRRIPLPGPRPWLRRCCRRFDRAGPLTTA